MISFTVDNTTIPLGDVWVHLKGEPRGVTKPYALLIPNEYLVEVFDPHGRKPAGQSWRDFVAEDIQEQGTWFVQGYLKTLMKLNGETIRQSNRAGVLATVDDVQEDSTGIRILGRIEEWCPETYSEPWDNKPFPQGRFAVAAWWSWLRNVWRRVGILTCDLGKVRRREQLPLDHAGKETQTMAVSPVTRNTLTRCVILLTTTAPIAYIAGGFVAGLFWADCGEGLIANTLGRAFIGVVMCLLSAMSLGFPPRNEGGVGPPFNAWPFILGCWAVILVVVYLWRRLSIRGQSDPTRDGR